MGMLSKLKGHYDEGRVKKLVRSTDYISKQINSELTKIGIKADVDDPRRYFKVLGIRPTDDRAVIRKAYIKQIKRYHPDVSTEENALERAKQINEAYGALTGRGMRYEIGIEHAISEKMKKSIQIGLLNAYRLKREKDYQSLLTSVGYNKNYTSIVVDEIRKYANWRRSLDEVSKALFGNVWAAEKTVSSLYAQNHRMLKKERNGTDIDALRQNAERLEDLKILSESVARDLRDIKNIVEDSLQKNEDAMASRLMHAN